MSVRSVWALLIGVAMLSLGNGLQGTLLGVRATQVEFSATVTGYVMSGYFIGILFGSIITPKLIGGVGHIRVFAAFASVVSTAALLYAVFVDPRAWFFFRVLSGMCVAGLYIVVESWLNSVSTSETRGQLLSLYMLTTFACMGVGQFLLNAASPGGFELFILVSVLVSIALVPMSLVKVTTPEFGSPKPVSVITIYQRSPLAVIACFFNGLGQSVLFSLGAVYGAMMGMNVAEVSVLMAMPMLGVIVSQFPIGMLSDRYDRRIILIIVSALTTVVSVFCLFPENYPTYVIIVLFGLFGALSLPLYSLALAHANDYLDYDQMLGAAGKLVLLFGVGATIGPIVAGELMEYSAAKGFFIYMTGVYGLITLFALYRTTRRASVPLEEQCDFMLVTPRTTQMSAAAIADETYDGELPAEASEVSANPG